MSNYLTLSKFYTPGDASYLTEMLEKNEIDYQINQEANQITSVFIGEVPDPMFVIKIKQVDFKLVNKLLAEQATADFQQQEFTHYFVDYQENELTEILKNPNEWNAYDLQIATLLLQQSNPAATPVNADYSGTYQPEQIAFSFIIIGYLLCFLTLFGIIIGLSITQAKRTLQNGQVVRIYDRQTIIHGRNMIAFGLIMTAFYIIIRLYTSRDLATFSLY